MSDAGPDSLAGGVSGERRLLGATVQGAVWNLLTALANKGVTVAGQLVLAWFLLPEDFGLVAVAVGLTGLVGTVADRGVADRLVQVQNPSLGFLQQCFWLAMAMRLVAMVALAAVLPLLAAIQQDPRIILLVVVEMVSWPIEVLWMPAENLAFRQLRFRLVSLAHLSRSLTFTISAVLFAWLGWGPLALILANLPGKVVQWAVFGLTVERTPPGRPDPRAWPPLLAPVAWLMVSACLLTIQASAMPVILGLVRSAEVAGYFSWAYQVAMQAVFLLAANLSRVFFPVLAAVGDDERSRRRMAVRMALLVLAALVPVMLLQAGLCGPLLHWVYGDKWDRAIPVIQVLSLGFIPFPLAIIANSVLKGRGDVRGLAWENALQTAATIGGGLIGLAFGDETAVAVGLAIGLGLSSVWSWRVVVRSGS